MLSCLQVIYTNTTGSYTKQYCNSSEDQRYQVTTDENDIIEVNGTVYYVKRSSEDNFKEINMTGFNKICVAREFTSNDHVHCKFENIRGLCFGFSNKDMTVLGDCFMPSSGILHVKTQKMPRE